MLKRLLKTATYRVVCTGFTILATYLLTGNPAIAGSVGLLDLIGKSVIYYIHETIWRD